MRNYSIMRHTPFLVATIILKADSILGPISAAWWCRNELNWWFSSIIIHYQHFQLLLLSGMIWFWTMFPQFRPCGVTKKTQGFVESDKKLKQALWQMYFIKCCHGFGVAKVTLSWICHGGRREPWFGDESLAGHPGESYHRHRVR